MEDEVEYQHAMHHEAYKAEQAKFNRQGEIYLLQKDKKKLRERVDQLLKQLASAQERKGKKQGGTHISFGIEYDQSDVNSLF